MGVVDRLRTNSLLIGPLNVAGQGYRWSEAVRSQLALEADSFAGTGRATRRMDGPSHYRAFHHRVRPRALRRARIASLIHGRTHLLSESMWPLFRDPRTETVVDELDFYGSRGVAVGVIFHGSEVRSPSRHLERVPGSFYHLWSEERRKEMESRSVRLTRSLSGAGLSAFVSTPDLLLDVPSAEWLPLVVDVNLWRGGRVAMTGARPVVVHCPSRYLPPIKGTALIDPILQKLDRENLIEYRKVGSVAHNDMPVLVRQADIVVEQILAGSYGVTAVEGMAASRLVVGYVGEDVRQLFLDVPIVDASAATFEATMRQIVEDRERYAERARLGREYVDRVHSGRFSARVLGRFMGLE